jgi:uncharacterized membrane protein YjgN (DUF898 family)
MGDATSTYQFRQRAGFWELASLAARNAGLGLITLTLFRFWARTSMRRRLWARTWLLGDPLEYTGTGGELVRGFLISLPTFFLPALFAINLAPLAFDRATAALIAFCFYCVAVPLIAAGRFWMRRYQLSRTRWRGIRLSLDGSGWSFAFASTGWTMLQVVTLGWYTPAARLNRARLMWRQTKFGDQSFRFGQAGEKPLEGLYGPFAIGWFGTPIGFFVGAFIGAIVGGIVGALILAALKSLGVYESEITREQLGSLPMVAYVVYSVFVLAFAIAFAALAWTPYNAAAMRRIAESIELDTARFRLKLDSGGLMLTTIACALVFILSLGFLAPLAGALYMRYITNRLEMIGQPRFAEIGQTVSEGPTSAEGTIDAFDLDFGVGIV